MPAKKIKAPIHIKVVSTMCDNVSYVILRDGPRGTEVSYQGGGETPLALSNLAQSNAVELRRALELCGFNASEAVKHIRHYGLGIKSATVL